ncbi:NAD(P)-dependent oxidoreductase [Lactococcus taiwanensis]|jgi:3-hydroxyisobutyrate dehydrogenase|uniref:NAD(P)-dependent oxidoreductase n=1 Tax=Lactococcus taiwanensis TaxID=1151742 RepID=A0AA45KIJ7_9LACT|nr:NAD(P)-dependent oxidoreductase [Lactococcus taiwanensis]QRZ10772.1 NAD(P)-dependent oxidoreductase [Lactococcus taiwanensis]QSE76851.1 NAD(P)-dependent oxidoreductase [Lactococcus taiwanensis]
MAKIAFIGTGVMGAAMAGHLMDAGHDLIVYNRTKSKTDDLVARGASYAQSPKLAAEKADFVITIVGYPKDVREVYFGTEGIFQNELSGKVLIDMTTTEPTLAKEIYTEAAKKEASALDAPVSGGDLGAKKATLTIMVGGDETTYDKAYPLFEAMGKTITLQGPAGSGQHTKMANQICIAGTMTGMTELLVYAQKAGLDLEKVLTTVGGGSGATWSLANYAPRILREDYSAGFFVKHFIKDLGIALAEAQKMGLELPATAQAKKLYDQLADKGFENDGTQALIKLWWDQGHLPK